MNQGLDQCFHCKKLRIIKADFGIDVLFASRDGHMKPLRVDLPTCGHCLRMMVGKTHGINGFALQVHLATRGMTPRLTVRQQAKADRKRAREQKLAEEEREREDLRQYITDNYGEDE